jgi:hypothetical protein
MGRYATYHKGGITAENAAEMQKRSQEAIKRNREERKVMRDIVLERVSAEDRAAICDALLEKAKGADKDSIKLLLQLLGEMPDEKMNIGMTLNALTDADRSLLKAVEDRV